MHVHLKYAIRLKSKPLNPIINTNYHRVYVRIKPQPFKSNQELALEQLLTTYKDNLIQAKLIETAGGTPHHVQLD